MRKNQSIESTAKIIQSMTRPIDNPKLSLGTKDDYNFIDVLALLLKILYLNLKRHLIKKSIGETS